MYVNFKVCLNGRSLAYPAYLFILICVVGPGNMHFDYGQDVYFIKPTKERPVQGATTKNTERR